MRVGIGYDVHKLAAGRKLILGGVEIPYDEGLLGHSDADVLIHAVMDALLGAAALGDIGRHSRYGYGIRGDFQHQASCACGRAFSAAGLCGWEY